MRIDRSLFAGLDQLRLAAPLPATGGRPGDRRSRARGRGVELADFRPYTPGDDLRLVDWNVYARLEAVLVRLFHEERDLAVTIVVDASASMGFARKLEHAGELAACLALLALRARDRVRVVVAGKRETSGQVKGSDVNAMAAIVQVLERAEPAGATELANALAALADAGRADQAFLLSDLLVEPDVREATLRRLAALSARPVLLHVLGDEELTPDLRDGAILIDSETGEELPVRGGRAAQKQYAEALARWKGEVEQSCKDSGVAYAPAFTTAPVRALVANELRHRRVVEATRGGGR